MHSTLKRKLAIGAASVGILGIAGGGAYAATQGGSTSNPRQAFLDDLAGRLHVTPQQLQSAIQGALGDQLDAAVKAGKLTQKQADAMKQRLQRKGAGGPLLGGPLAGGPPAGRPFGGPLGPGGPGGPGPARPFPGGGPGLFFGGLDAAAKYLGLTDAQLLTQLRSGKTLAQIAAAKGKTADGLTAAVKAAVKSRLDKAVSGKKLTSAQESKILAGLDQALSRLVNAKRPLAPFAGGARLRGGRPAFPRGAHPRFRFPGGPGAPRMHR